MNRSPSTKVFEGSNILAGVNRQLSGRTRAKHGVAVHLQYLQRDGLMGATIIPGKGTGGEVWHPPFHLR